MDMENPNNSCERKLYFEIFMTSGHRQGLTDHSENLIKTRPVLLATS